MKIDEIAKIAGVSKTTVSRVLNNRPDVNPKTRSKVMKIIADFNYEPNAMAKAISTRRNHTIGLIIPYDSNYIFSNQYYVELMRGIFTEADKKGYYLLICYPHNHDYVEMFKQKRVEGYIVISPGSDHQYLLHSLVAVNAPFVSTSNVIGWDTQINVVDVDNYSGGRQMTEYLTKLGHREIAYIGKKSITSSMDRLCGYKDVLEENGIPYRDSMVRIIEGGTIANAEEAAADLLKNNHNLTAIFAASDMLAIGAIKRLKAMGKQVPDDISVVGFDDIPFAVHCDPPITTMRQPSAEKGTEAIKMLIDILEGGKDDECEIKLLDLSLIERKSAIDIGNK
jgi:LacI family transcriptional regulator